MRKTDNSFSLAPTMEDTIMASKLHMIVSSTVFELPVSSFHISPLQPFCEISQKLSSTPSSDVCVHSKSVITIQTPPLSSPKASVITSSVILPSSQSSKMLQAQTFFPNATLTIVREICGNGIVAIFIAIDTDSCRDSGIATVPDNCHDCCIAKTSVCMLLSPTISAEMLASLSSQNSAIMLSALSLPSLWTQAETKNKQHTNSRLSTQPDQLQIQSPQQNIPIVSTSKTSVLDIPTLAILKCLVKGDSS
ncbi:unnamed protein product [Mytilus edulis]|uniref:Uncharacterized protein n=1 Tax=Mytilus edulis TaxID=6550 RepID=A0A8S3QMH9_MYTED|nr:unnamed protein product [Mytilus edulis]